MSDGFGGDGFAPTIGDGISFPDPPVDGFLVVENGNGLPLANTYITYDEFISYLTTAGFVAPPGLSTTQIEQAMIRAAYRVDTREAEFFGERVNCDQGMSFGRKGYYANCTRDLFVPREAKLAQAAYAAEELTTGYSLPTTGDTSSDLVQKRIKNRLDVLEQEIEYFEPGADYVSDAQNVLARRSGDRFMEQLISLGHLKRAASGFQVYRTRRA